MIQITFHKTRTGDYQGFTCSGHAGYAAYGEDIVCAAVSALVINGSLFLVSSSSLKAKHTVNKRK